jgi:hypothetical protein
VIKREIKKSSKDLEEELERKRMLHLLNAMAEK